MTAYEMLRAMERIIEQTDPRLIIDDKPSSDLLYQYLYQYMLTYIRTVYLQADQVNDETRANNKVIDSIKGLATRVNLNVADTDSLNEYTSKITLPSDFFLYIRSNSKVTSNYLQNTSTDQIITPNKVMKEENVEAVQTTFYNKPIIRNPFVIFKSETNGDLTMEIIHDAYTTLNEIELLYYRKPKQFGTTHIEGSTKEEQCELPENVHMEIVEGAAKLFLSDRFAAKSNNKEQQR